MATRGKRLREGKSLGKPAIKCRLCMEDAALKYCVDCNFELCNRCVIGHGNLPMVKNHLLLDIGDVLSTTYRSSRASLIHCRRHPNQPLCSICEDCFQELCDKCDDDHIGHKRTHSNLDMSALRYICAQKIPGLMEIADQLESVSNGSTKRVELYKKAKLLIIEWRERLTKIISEDSDRLLNDIDIEINEQQVSINTTKLQNIVSNTDNFITILGNARKITDASLLLRNIHVCDQFIQWTKAIIADVESMTKSVTIDDLFPFRKELPLVEKGLHGFFYMNQLSKTGSMMASGDTACSSIRNSVPTDSISKKTISKATPKYKGMRQVAHKNLRKSAQGVFFFSESADDDNNSVVIYDVLGTAVHVFDIGKNTLKSFICDKNISRMCSLSSGKYIIQEYLTNDIHVVDKNFKTLATMKRSNDYDSYKPFAVCCKKNNTFIMSEVEIKDLNKTRLSEVTVRTDNTFVSKMLCEVDVCNPGGFLSLLLDREYAMISTGTPTECTSICKINLLSGQYTEVELYGYLDSDIASIYTDAGCNVLVGDETGNIHKLTNMKYEGTLSSLKFDKWITGMTTRGDKLIIISGERLKIYQ